MTTVDELTQQHDSQRESYLKEHGWVRGMWRWYWVWRKQTHDASFVCMTVEDALRFEGALQSTEDCYPAKAETP